MFIGYLRHPSQRADPQHSLNFGDVGTSYIRTHGMRNMTKFCMVIKLGDRTIFVGSAVPRAKIFVTQMLTCNLL